MELLRFAAVGAAAVVFVGEFDVWWANSTPSYIVPLNSIETTNCWSPVDASPRKNEERKLVKIWMWTEHWTETQSDAKNQRSVKCECEKTTVKRVKSLNEK